jgi:predicted transcriptional regulator
MTDFRVRGLISIRPYHADRIYRRLKAAEFRRRRVRLSFPAWVAIYECKPIAAVTGVMQVYSISHGDPSTLVEFEPDSRERATVAAYLSGAVVASALHVDDVHRLSSPAPLVRFGLRRPPQSYVLLDLNCRFDVDTLSRSASGAQSHKHITGVPA